MQQGWDLQDLVRIFEPARWTLVPSYSECAVICPSIIVPVSLICTCNHLKYRKLAFQNAFNRPSVQLSLPLLIRPSSCIAVKNKKRNGGFPGTSRRVLNLSLGFQAILSSQNNILNTLCATVVCLQNSREKLNAKSKRWNLSTKSLSSREDNSNQNKNKQPEVNWQRYHRTSLWFFDACEK